MSAGNAARKNPSRGGGWWVGLMNQIFMLTCLASLTIQFLSSWASWHNMDGSRHLGMAEEGSHSLANYAALAVSRDDRVSIPAVDQVVDSLPERLQYGPPKHSRRLRVLFGILTADFKNDEAYRKRHRTLFKLWNDKRVCSLPDFKTMPLEDRYECEIIYTFVVGANPDSPPELVDESRPFEVDRPYRGQCKDLNEPDVTLLNIR